MTSGGFRIVSDTLVMWRNAVMSVKEKRWHIRQQHVSKSKVLRSIYESKRDKCTTTFSNNMTMDITSVSETIRMPPLVKAQTTLKNKINKIWRKTMFNMADGIITPCNVACGWHGFRQVTAACSVACGSGIMTVNSTSGSTLQCNTWLWDDMPWNSPKRPPYWSYTSGSNFDHITAVDMSFCTSLRNVIQIGLPSVEKHDVMSIFKMADLSHLGF